MLASSLKCGRQTGVCGLKKSESCNYWCYCTIYSAQVWKTNCVCVRVWMTRGDLFLLLLASLLSCGFHGTLEWALKWMKLIGCLLQQEAGHKLLQVGGLLIILSIKAIRGGQVRVGGTAKEGRTRRAVTRFTCQPGVTRRPDLLC